jgi:hypothetical protein
MAASDRPDRPDRPVRLLPLTVGPSRSRNRDGLREAVVQVIGHLVVEAVPPSSRSPHFEQAQGLLEEAGWGLDELCTATEEGPERQELLRVIGLA